MMAVTAHAAQFSSNNAVTSNNIWEFSLLNHCLRQGGAWTTEDLRGIFIFFIFFWFWKMIVIFVDFTRVCQFGRPSSLPLWKELVPSRGNCWCSDKARIRHRFPTDADKVSCSTLASRSSLGVGLSREHTGLPTLLTKKWMRCIVGPLWLFGLKAYLGGYFSFCFKTQKVMLEYADCLNQVLMLFSYELLLSSAVCTETE